MLNENDKIPNSDTPDSFAESGLNHETPSCLSIRERNKFPRNFIKSNKKKLKLKDVFFSKNRNNITSSNDSSKNKSQGKQVIMSNLREYVPEGILNQ
jgi:hypothetical protein